MDKISKLARSQNMAAVRSKNTKPELRVRSAIHRNGFRFSLHRRDLPGRPDLVLPKYRSVIFVHGCFWHGHNCSRGKRPTSNTTFWKHKLEGNRNRDQRNIEALLNLGWDVMVIWECEIDAGIIRAIRNLKKKQRKAEVATSSKDH